MQLETVVFTVRTEQVKTHSFRLCVRAFAQTHENWMLLLLIKDSFFFLS